MKPAIFWPEPAWMFARKSLTGEARLAEWRGEPMKMIAPLVCFDLICTIESLRVKFCSNCYRIKKKQK